MDDTLHAVYTSYIADLAERLRLRDWEFTLKRESSPKDTFAEVQVHRHRRWADIFVCDDWLTVGGEQQRLTLVHELLHVHTSRLRRTMGRLNDTTSGGAIAYANATLDEEEEIVVDTLSRILAPLLPLPPEVKNAAQ